MEKEDNPRSQIEGRKRGFTFTRYSTSKSSTTRNRSSRKPPSTTCSSDAISRPRKSSRTLVRPTFNGALHRPIGQHWLGLGVPAAPRGHEIECRLVGFARLVGHDHFKGAQGGSSRIEPKCRFTPRSHGQVLSRQHDSRWSSPEDVIQVPRTDDRDQGSRTLVSRKQDSLGGGLHSQRGKFGGQLKADALLETRVGGASRGR